MLHFLQRKNVVSYIFYNEKMLNVTLFTAKSVTRFVLFLTGIPQQKIIVNDGFKTQPFKGAIGYGRKIRQIFHSGKSQHAVFF